MHAIRHTNTGCPLVVWMIDVFEKGEFKAAAMTIKEKEGVHSDLSKVSILSMYSRMFSNIFDVTDPVSLQVTYYVSTLFPWNSQTGPWGKYLSSPKLFSSRLMAGLPVGVTQG